MSSRKKIAPERTLSQRVDSLEREQAQQAMDLAEVKKRLEYLEGNTNNIIQKHNKEKGVTIPKGGTS